MSKPAQQPLSGSVDLEQLQSLADHKLSLLVKKYPVFASLLTDKSQPIPADNNRGLNGDFQPTDQLPTTNYPPPAHQTQSSPLIATVTTDEVKELFTKLRSVMADNQLWLDRTMRLYLEQQITDLIGFEVTSQVGGEVIPICHGRVLALSHQKRQAHDTLAQHRSHLEAGLSRYRSPLQLNSSADDLIYIEQYAVHYPFWMMSKYQVSPIQILDQFIPYKWLIINPINERLVVGQTAGVLPPLHRYRLGLSPELIRLGKLWWPGTTGDALCLLIDKKAPSGLLYDS